FDRRCEDIPRSDCAVSFRQRHGSNLPSDLSGLAWSFALVKIGTGIFASPMRDVIAGLCTLLMRPAGDKAQDATRFWFDTRANLRGEMEDRKRRFPFGTKQETASSTTLHESPDLVFFPDHPKCDETFRIQSLRL